MAQIDIPIVAKIKLYEKLEEHAKETGVKIDPKHFAGLAILEKMERQFTKKMGHPSRR